MKTIQDLLISTGELDRIYTGRLSLFLWRALHKSSTTTNPLYPDFEEREITRGVLRAPDVKIKVINGVEHVVSVLEGGTSLFDRAGAFGSVNWTYFEIPAGTEIPAGLIITKDHFSRKYKATHYSLSPNYTMPKQQFMLLLDQLAANALRAKGTVRGGR